MEPSTPHNASNNYLFDVYLRLRPHFTSRTVLQDRFLEVEPALPSGEGVDVVSSTEARPPTHITIKPPAHDHRKRAVEKFGFTRVFEEAASQDEVFRGVGVEELVEGVLGGKSGGIGRDGLLATLGVTGSGKVILTSTFTPKFRTRCAKQLLCYRVTLYWALARSEE